MSAKILITFSSVLLLSMLSGSTLCDAQSHTAPTCKLCTPNYDDIVCHLSGKVLYVFELDIHNLKEDHVKIYKPWRYYMTSSTHGMTLLSLSFNYDVLSLTLLNIGVEKIYVELNDFPKGCFGELSRNQQVLKIKQKLFDIFELKKYHCDIENATSSNNTTEGNDLDHDYPPPDYSDESTFNSKVDLYNATDKHASMTILNTTGTDRNSTLHRNSDAIDQTGKVVNYTIGTEEASSRTVTIDIEFVDYDQPNYDYPFISDVRCKNTEEWDLYVCNGIIRNESGYAEFSNVCCTNNLSNPLICTEQDGNMWITVLYVCIGAAKTIIFLFSPVFIPDAMHLKLVRKYLVKFKQQFKMKVYLGDATTPSVRCKNATTWNNIAKWPQFANNLEHIPKNTVCSLEVKNAIIEVQGKRIIKGNYPPAGLVRTLYDNFVRCKISRTDPFRSCCYSSVYPCVKPKYTWKTLFQPFIRIIGYIIVPLPLLIRLYIYYNFEEEELNLRQTAIEKRGLKKRYHPIRMSLIQYLSPTNGLLITLYAFQVLAVLLFLFAGQSVRTKLKFILQSALFDMKSVSRTSVFSIVLKYILWAFKEYGCVALLMSPVFLVLAVPLCACIFILYSVPTIYLSFRLVYHCKRTFGGVKPFSWSEQSPHDGQKKIKKIRVGLAKLDQKAHVPRKSFVGVGKTEIKPKPQVHGCSTFHRFCLQVGFSVFFLVLLYSILFFLVETGGLVIDVWVFTLMGLVVNARETLKYISLAVLVLVYMRKCYHTVYKLYLTLNRSLIDHVVKRTDDLSQVASLPSSVQKNVAFQMKTIEAVDEIRTSLNFKKPTKPCLNIGHLVLFFDSHDTPRIPVNFFKAICNICVYGAPGPVYVNLLRATGRFVLIMAFLTFLMVVIMAFGNAYELSQTHQFLATIAGGALPLLMDFLPATKVAPLELDTLSFEGLVDEVIADYKQNWPIVDLVVGEIDINMKDKAVESDDANGAHIDTNQVVAGYGGTEEQHRAQFKSGGEEDNDNGSKENIADGSKETSTLLSRQIPQPLAVPVEEMVDLYIDISSNECFVPCEETFKDGDDTATEMITM